MATNQKTLNELFKDIYGDAIAEALKDTTIHEGEHYFIQKEISVLMSVSNGGKYSVVNKKTAETSYFNNEEDAIKEWKQLESAEKFNAELKDILAGDT